MGLMLQLILQLMNLCIIVTAIGFSGSSAFGEPLSLESPSPFPSTEAQVPTSIVEQGPFLNGSIVQPPIVSPSIYTSPVHQFIEGPPPFLSPKQSTALSPQSLSVSAPQLPAEPPKSSVYSTAKPPQHSNSPVAELPHDPPPSEPPIYTPPVHHLIEGPPPFLSPKQSITFPPQPLHVSAPQLPAEPPKSSVFSAAKAPQHSGSPIAELPHDDAPPLPASQPSPHHSTSPSSAEPPYISKMSPPAKPPYASGVQPTAKAPVAIPQLPTAKPPEALPLASSPSPPEAPQPIALPIPSSGPPLFSIPANVSSHASPQPSVAKPPLSSALPMAAKPPESNPRLPSVVAPAKSPLPSDIQSPLSQNKSSSQPQLSPYALSPPPQLVSPNAPPPMSIVYPHASVSPSPAPPTTFPSLSPLPTNIVSPQPSLLPPIVSSPPPQLVPPIESAPPPQLIPPIVFAPPPESSPPIVSSPPPQLIPPIESPPPQLSPPIVSAHPPELTPPIVSSPPPQLIPPIDSAPPPQLTPPIVSASPPELTPPVVSSPPPQLIPPIESAPPELTPPIVSSPPPQPIPPIEYHPQLTPPIASHPPLELTPPLVAPPPSQPIPPIESAPPQLSPPIVSPPQLITPPASPTPAVPSNASAQPPLFLPPPQLPLSPPDAPPHASPPMPSHAVSPLPQPTKPHAPSPPYDLSAPPPVDLPHFSPPLSPIVPRTVPPYPSLPSPFLTPPLAPYSPVIPSHLSAPPPSEPLHSSVPPSPAMQRTVSAAPPQSSQRKETHEGAPPPLLTSPESSPSSKTLPEAPPPALQVTQRSHPPSSHEKKQSPPLRSNATEPATLPSSAPSPSKIPVGRYPSVAPPGRAPDPLPGDEPSQYPAAAAPAIERHDPTAPTPLSFSISPTSNISRHSLHHIPVKGPPAPMAPLPSPPGIPEISPAPSILPRDPSDHSRIPVPSPKISPFGSSTRNTKRPLAPPIRSLPPPPPNADCAYMTCDEPLTNTPPGSPCGCVWPMQVGIRLGVALYTFFPLVSELAREIATGVYMNTNQVRVMGANATTEELDKTIVIVNLVPLHEKIENPTALWIFQRFWHKQIVIDKSLFGDYDILYVRYPGLPPSPPMAPADIAIINGMPYSVGDPNKLHPLGVDVTKQRHKHRLSGIIIAAVVFSAIVALLICCFVAWLLVFRHTNNEPQPAEIPRALPSLGRSSGPTGNSTGSGPSSSLSIGSSLPPYTGSAKTFSASEIEKATDNLNPSRILGEGGFGLVYSGVLEDTTHVAVKVLKRDDQQGGREFLAEVEMLSRLHHRNLVKLIGICTDERLRCLVYELIPNGSVESHLHGRDKETAPLDWASRMKIALGAARGLAYLHEDSSPRVIHRDFKASNILLENDFTPKVSDFGLARAAMDEENRHISTRVMGTFGYVAPEYAMTGHLLVKSDVYSYGVVLLEILTGRKPVDMSQPPGQENLVAWTRPFLSTQEGLESILDPSLGIDVPLDSVAKVAAIASMCVQPEVSHRPFMGEVVQALKLVCNESDDSKGSSARHGSHGNLSADFDAKGSPISETRDHLPSQFSIKNYLSGLDAEKGMSVSEIFGASVRTDRQASDSFRRHSASGPLKTERTRHFWQRIRRLSNGGSVSEHGIMYRLWAGSQ